MVVEAVAEDTFIYKPGIKFTEDLYRQYAREPLYRLDGFDDKASYESYWSGTISEWLLQSKSKTDKWKSTCRKALQQVEYMEVLLRSIQISTKV